MSESKPADLMQKLNSLAQTTEYYLDGAYEKETAYLLIAVPFNDVDQAINYVTNMDNDSAIKMMRALADDLEGVNLEPRGATH